MDATKKPLLIPPEFANYAQKHGVFQLYEVSFPFAEKFLVQLFLKIAKMLCFCCRRLIAILTWRTKINEN